MRILRILLCLTLSAFASVSGGFSQAKATDKGAPIFIDITREAGIDFVYFNGMWGQSYLPEITGAGCALLDFDNDGDLDIYLVQGHMLGPGKTAADAILPPWKEGPLKDLLLANNLNVSGAGSKPARVTFTEVTDKSGILAEGYGMGVATGDIDGDGWVDIYVTNFGPNQLFRNNGDGTFSDWTKRSGTAGNAWSVSSSFLDYDGDGDLDLYVGDYIEWDYVQHVSCPSPTAPNDYCRPMKHRSEPDHLYRNRGDGTFEDVSREAGLRADYGRALGVVTADFNGDNRIDVYVANDDGANQLWLASAEGEFRNEALLGGCAVNDSGAPEASMGVDAADFDGDGDEDLFMTHLSQQTNTIYVNDGTGLFLDVTQSSRLANVSWEYTSFGTRWFDYDNDGWLDIFVASGAVHVIPALARAGDPFPLHQPNQLFRSQEGKSYDNVSDRAGEPFQVSEVSRGAAFGDVDNDGDTDILVSNNSGPARLLINTLGQDTPWIGFRVVDSNGKRDMLGARVELLRKGAGSLYRRARTDGSYASASDPRVLLGLGAGKDLQKLRVHWSDGSVEEWDPPQLRTYSILKRGQGRLVE